MDYYKIKTDIYLDRYGDDPNVHHTNDSDASKKEILQLKVEDKKMSGTCMD